MALVVKDRVKETTTTTGTGSISLGGAVTKFKTFSSALSNADTTYYAIEQEGATNEFEVGIGTYASSGNTLARTTILSSSNSNNAVDFSAGTKNIFITYPADKAVYEDASGDISVSGTVDGVDIASRDAVLTSTTTTANAAMPTSGGTFTSDVTFSDGEYAKFGADNDLWIGHVGSTISLIANYNEDLQITNHAVDKDIQIRTDNGSGSNTTYFMADGSTGEALLYHYGSEKLATKSTGVDVTGAITVSGTVDGVDIAARDLVLTSTTTTADAAMPLSGGTFTGDVKIGFDPNPDFDADGSGSVSSADALDYVSIAQGADNNEFEHLLGIEAPWTDTTIKHHYKVMKGSSTGALREAVGTSGTDFGDLVVFGNVHSDGTNENITTGMTIDGGNLRLIAQGEADHSATGNASMTIDAADIVVTGTVDGRDLATDGTKLDGIASSANNYVHPNHSGEVTSSGDGATVIVDNVVDEANLKVSNSPTNGYVLTAQSGNTGGLTWAAASGGGGGGADLYDADTSGTPTDPSATGTNAVAIGNGATAAGNYGIGIGFVSDATGASSVAIGYNADATGANSLAIGNQPDAKSFLSTAIGANSTGNGSQAVTGSGAMALGGSYASGTDSFAAAITNNTSSYGATGTNSIAVGYQAKATGYASFADGYQATASGLYSRSLGGSNGSTASGTNSFAWGTFAQATTTYAIAFGPFASASLNSSVAIGNASTPNAIGKMAFGNGATDHQIGFNLLRQRTTDATATQMTTNDTSASTTNGIVLQSNAAYAFSGTIVGKQQSSANCSAWEIKGLIVNNGGTMALVNSAITVIDNQNNWGLALSADSTNKALAITVTGAASTNIYWNASITTSEVED